MSGKKNIVDVNSNADGLAVAKGLGLLDQLDVGDYQGQTVVLLEDTEHDTIHVYVISYGSCGGCDWFEDFYGQPVSYKDCLDQFSDYAPRFIFPRTAMPSAKQLFDSLHEPDSGYQGMNAEYGWTVKAASNLLKAVRASA